MFALQIMAVLWGACFGSFLNVVIYRLPHGMSLMHPGSHCCSCDAPIRFYDNIPILSYLILRGKCRRCHAPYSPRYMLIEAACAVISLALFQEHVQFSDLYLEQSELISRICLWFYFLAFALALIALSFIDLAHFFLPDEITLPGIALGLLGAYALPALNGNEHLIAAIAAFVVLGGVALLGRVAFHREALGMGDIKLLSMIGAFLGWKAIPFVLFAAAFQGLIAYGISRLYHGITGKSAGLAVTSEEIDQRFGEETPKESRSHQVIPFGPFLGLGAIEAMLFGDLTWRFFSDFWVDF